MIYDKGQNTANEVKLYIDGELSPLVKKTGSNNNTNNFGKESFYMMSRGGITEFEQGYIDDVKIFNYALTPHQIRQEYNAGAVRFGQ